MVEYSIIIPVYNSEKSLEALFGRICMVFETLQQSFEVIMVDDGSSDNSWAVLQNIFAHDNRVVVLRLMRNYGQHNALMCGLHQAAGNNIITMDDDGENRPEEIPALIEGLHKGYDLVYGSYSNASHGGTRTLGSNCVQFFYRAVFGVKNNLTSFRIFTRSLAETIKTYQKNYVFIDGLLAWNTKKIGEVPVVHGSSIRTRSGYSFRKLFVLAMNLSTNFSIMPLQVASLFGVLCFLSGFGMGSYFVVKKIMFGIPVAGYASLMAVITMFSGVQLLTLGVIGEYIGRIHLNINNKSQYCIRDRHKHS